MQLFKKNAPFWDILWLFLATRFILLLVTYAGFIFLTQEPYASTPTSVGTFLLTWNQWDAKVYLQIAQFGYQTVDSLAFFPLYPALIALIAHPLGNWSYPLVGMLLSNGALFGAMLLIYQLAWLEAGTEQVARRTLLYLCIFPTAFFFFAAYNESLFLLLAAGCLLALRRQRWWLAGLLGCLTILTRSVGVFLALPFLYELWLKRERVRASWRSLLFALTPLLLLPLGLVLFALYCWKTTGNPLAFAAVQSHWSRQLSWPWQGIWQNLFELFWNQPFGSFNEVHVLLDLSAALGFCVLAVLGRKRLRLDYTLWVAVMLFYYLLSPSIWQHDGLISFQRFVLEMFPAFITLALLAQQHPRLHQTLLWVFPALLATLSLLFVMGKWMV